MCLGGKTYYKGESTKNDRCLWTTSPGTTFGLQDVYYSAGFWREACGWAYDVTGAAHPGFLLALGQTSPKPAPAGCKRVLTH